MEDLSYLYSPKARDFITTQTTNMTSSRLSLDCNLCPRTSPYQKDDLTVTDLKREYSKAMNCIEILKLEKKNLQDALTITKDFKKDKTDKFFVSSTRCTTAVNSPKGDFRPAVKSVEVDRRVVELEQELVEQRRLLERSAAHNEQLKRENYAFRERLQEVDNLQLQNHQYKTDIRELTEELRRESRRVYELEEENEQLLDRRAQLTNSSKKLPPKELYKYLDHVYELIGSLNRNHYAHYQFRECFIDESNIEALIEEKETNELLVQSFRYITNLLMNINSSVSASTDQRRASRIILTESGSDNQQRMEQRENGVSYNDVGGTSYVQYSVHEDDAQPPNPTPLANVPSQLNLNVVSREIDEQPHSFGRPNPTLLSQQDLNPEYRTQNSVTKVYSPTQSRNMISNSYSNKPNTDFNTTRRDLSRSPSQKSGISMTSPANRRDKSPSSKHATEVNAAANVSKQSLGRSHVSQRNLNQTADANNALNASRVSQGKSVVSRANIQNAETNGLNASRVSQGKSPVSRANFNNTEANNLNASRQSLGKSPVSRTNFNNTEANNLNASRQSLGKSHVSHHTVHQNVVEDDYYQERTPNHRDITQDFEDREMRLRELDRELQEKDRMLQMKEKELKDKSVMEKSMSRYNRAQEEAEVNRSTISQSRKLASQKSLLKEKSVHQSRQKLDESRENTRVLKSQTQLKASSHAEIDRANTNLNRSPSNLQSRIIPSMSSLNEIDMSPKSFGVSPKHTQNQLKSLAKVPGSVQSIDAYSEYQKTPKAFATTNSQKFLNVAFADGNDVSASRVGGQRVAYQDANADHQSFENTPRSKMTPQPQILERLENSGIRLVDQRSREDFDNSQVYESTPNMMPLNIGSPKSENERRRVAFDDRNLGEIEEIESSPQSKSLSRNGEPTSAKKGVEYASFRVSFGRTQSKYMRSQSPDVDAKESLYIVDVARRKKVTHSEQTYDVVQGNEVRYEKSPKGGDYFISKTKPYSKYEPRSQNQSDSVDKSPQMTSPQSAHRIEN